jgi:hypothetical protein
MYTTPGRVVLIGTNTDHRGIKLELFHFHKTKVIKFLN